MATISLSNGKVECTIQGTYRNTLSDGNIAAVSVGTKFLTQVLTSGVEGTQANRAWARTGATITSGATSDIDLYDFAGIDIGGGAGNDGLGQAMALEEIVAIAIHQTAGAGRLEIMPANPANHCTWMPSLTVANGGALKSGGVLMMVQTNTDAFDISDGVSHMIRLGANGGNVTYAMYILGRHDDNLSTSSSESSSSQSSSSSSSQSTSSSSQSTSSSASSSSQSTSSSASSSSESSSSLGLTSSCSSP